MCAFWFHIKDTSFNSFSFFHSFSFFYSLSISSLWTIWNSLLVWLNNHHNHCNHLHSLSQFPDYTSQISMLHLKICHLGTQELTVTESTFFHFIEVLMCFFVLPIHDFLVWKIRLWYMGPSLEASLILCSLQVFLQAFMTLRQQVKVNSYWHLDWLFLQDIFISSLDISIILPSYMNSVYIDHSVTSYKDLYGHHSEQYLWVRSAAKLDMLINLLEFLFPVSW